MTGAEAKALRSEEIGIELKRLREKLFMLRSQTVTEKVEDTSQFVKVRKDIARLMTERNVRHHEAERKKKEAADRKKAEARAATAGAR